MVAIMQITDNSRYEKKVKFSYAAIPSSNVVVTSVNLVLTQKTICEWGVSAVSHGYCRGNEYLLKIVNNHVCTTLGY